MGRCVAFSPISRSLTRTRTYCAKGIARQCPHRVRDDFTKPLQRPAPWRIAPLDTRSSELRNRVDRQRPRWRNDSLGGVADAGMQPESDGLSSPQQRALLGSALELFRLGSRLL